MRRSCVSTKRDTGRRRSIISRGSITRPRKSHAASHRTFSELTPSERALELESSKAALESELGKTVQLFAYPYGDDGGAAAQVREAGYRAAFGYGGGPISMPPEDPYRVERLAIGPDSNLEAMLHGS